MNRFRRDGFVCIGQAVHSPSFRPTKPVTAEAML
jgi:hypothetical protein